MNTNMIGHKIACIIALGIVATDCVEKALGVTPQFLFSGEYIWAWWFPAIWWGMTMFGVFFVRVTK